MFRDRNFSLGILASIMGYGLMAGNGVLMPFYIEYILRIPVQQAGFILMTFALVFSMLSPFAGRMSDRMSKTRLTSSGMFLATLSCLFFFIFLPSTNLIFVFIFLVLMGISYSMFITPNNNLVMSLAKGERQSVTSSVFRLSTNLGQLLGVLMMESMFTLCLPSSEQPTAMQLKQATRGILLEGFRYSYLGGAILVFFAMITSRFIRDKKSGGKSETVEML
jgi:MFS family permease